MTFFLVALLALGLSLPFVSFAQDMPPIGTIDYYGIRRVSKAEVERALQIKTGAKVSKPLLRAEKRLQALPGVASAKLNFVCCDPTGKTILYVGIQETGARTLRFRVAPKENVKLPPEIVAAEQSFEDALMKAVEAGDAGEDDSQGYTLNHNPALRAVQERFIGFAARDVALLRNVLHTSSNADQRALAAEVMGYSEDHRAVVPDLEYAMSDRDYNVRNNAMRALAVIAGYANTHPSLGINIPAHPFIKMLNSLVWNDRDKAGFALRQLTENRDPAVLAELRKDALPALVEMARWKTPGHADMFCILLGRIAGLPEKTISSDLASGQKEEIIAAALRTQHQKSSQLSPRFGPLAGVAPRRAARATPAAIQAGG